MVSNGDIRVFYIAKDGTCSRMMHSRKFQNDMILLALFAVIDFAVFHLATGRQQVLKLALPSARLQVFLMRGFLPHRAIEWVISNRF